VGAKLPIAHASQRLLPTALERCPAGQGVQVDAPPLEKVPDGHGWHGEFGPLSAAVPGGQMEHCDNPADGATEPIAQFVHVVPPKVDWNFPAKH